MLKLIAFLSFFACAVTATLQFDVLSGNIDGKIYNGMRANRGQLPYVGFLYANVTRLTPDTVHFMLCSASLISSTWVMTAAHCAQGVSLVSVYLGLLDRYNKTGGVIYYNITKSNIFIHPEYNADTVEGDIALIKLPSAVPLNNYPNIKPIRLPKRSETPVSYFDNKNGTASGFGAFNDTNVASQYLLYAPVHIMRHSDCAATASYNVSDGKICADKTTHHGICPGDSGGPLAVQGTDGTPVVVGIASYIIEYCSDPNNPTFSTFTGFYLDWIHKITNIPIVN